MEIHLWKRQLSYTCDHNHFSCSAIDLSTMRSLFAHKDSKGREWLKQDKKTEGWWDKGAEEESRDES